MRRTASFLTIIVLALPIWVAAAPTATAAGPGSSIGGAAAPPSVASGTGSVGRGTFRFFGSGWGHGLGMSQWGAYGLGKKGWSSTKILTRFYRGTKVVRAASPLKSIRIGLTYDRTKIHLTARGGPVRLWAGKPHGKTVGAIPNGDTWTVRPTRTGYGVHAQSGKLVGGHTWGGPSFNLYATFADTGSRVFVPEADAIWGKGFTYARGFFEFNLYGCGSGACHERLVLPIAFEQYLYGLGEVPASWPMESLKAQATAARTFATYMTKHYAQRDYCACDLTDGSNDQTYVGYDKESGPDGKRWVHAVNATKGRVVTYHGGVIQAFYAASDGGHSDSVEDVWHDGNPAYAIPYLTGVCDPGEYTLANPWTNWSRSFSTSELTSRLSPYTGGIGTVTGFPKVKRGGGGRIIHATAHGTSGSAVVTGTEIRAALALPDDRVWINGNKNVVGAIRAKYDGLDCAPGLPTSTTATLHDGARQRFRTGAIYRNSVDDVTTWLKGPVYDEYLGAGGATGNLGLPTSQVAGVRPPGVGARAPGGKRILFQHGRIYWKTGPGAHALWGKLLKVYLSHGGATGALGFPTTRLRTSGGDTSADFEHGHIECPAGRACQVTVS